MKRLIFLLLFLSLLVSSAVAEETGVVIDRTANLTEEYLFPEGTPLLEIVFPRVFSSDCAILRFGEETMILPATWKTAPRLPIRKTSPRVVSRRIF